MAREELSFVDDLHRALLEYCGGSFTMYNIGAQDAYESGIIAERTPGAQIFCIEGCTGYTPPSGVQYAVGVIGATNGPAVFHVMGDMALSSTYNRGGTITNVEMERLDTYIASRGLPEPDALFMDTEGTAMDVLVGCGELLHRVKFICAEVQEVMLYQGGYLTADVTRFLEAFGLKRVPGGYSAGVQANWFWARPGAASKTGDTGPRL